ncbi:UDP-galactopyranose mutase [Bacteroides sp. 519]|uniref:UDP-galactopyranose mutase n=1 Tax=Bacteroides sp. 519 TaxID=2302937 RepID=UPI0013D74AFF|nr:UDP-galactopyranose mutase [Bacteroides sp. 519]NDV57152.1 UDP-galactopyranose mutase [Bacteroides sp. 519]
MEYDYLLVGAGLFNAVFAYLAAEDRKKCLVVEKRSHIGGNLYTEKVEGINVHKYGAHIFHTKNKDIWDLMNRFCEFNHFVNSPLARYKDELIKSIHVKWQIIQLWNTKVPEEALKKIESQRLKKQTAFNFEEQALKLVGHDIYVKLLKGYTEKQWGKQATELPMFLIDRIPLRFTFNNNYFEDPYQGIPIGGYNQIFEACFRKADVLLNTDYFKNTDLQKKADKLIFTGMIDQFYNYCYGNLEYRSLYFEEEVLDIENFQGNAVVNYIDKETPFTRIIEHKHFEFGKQSKTVITKEYPVAWQNEMEPYYPINTTKNNELYNRYVALSKRNAQIYFGGRLGAYKYYDMDKTVKASIQLYHEINNYQP